MRFSPVVLATLSMVYGAVQYGTSSTQDMTGVRGAMTNHQQVVDTLNNQLKGNGDIHANADRLVAYITGADSQIDNAIATVGEFLAPITGGLSMDIADVILGPFVQSVTNGAEVFLANMIGGAEDRMDAEMVGRLTGDYSRLNELSVKYNVNTSKLQSLSQQIQNTIPKGKRAVQYGTSSTQDMTGVRGAMTNHQQVVDTLNNQLKGHGDIHANADRLVAYITGADSQIDNAIATVGEFLAPITGGLSMDIADVILGPFVQSVTNGAEVFLANMIGGAEDRVDAEMVGRLTGDYSRLNELSVKYNVNTSKLQNLSQQIQNTIPKGKRAVQYGTSSTQDMTGVRGAMTNHQQVVDTLNNQLKGNGDIHANADRLVAYITGADSQIDNAIATVGEFLAPITGGLSMDIADVILGPFVQSVTNGAEVFLANMIGGAEDRVDAEMVGRLTGDYSRLNELSVKYNVNTSKLQNLSQQIQNTIPKGKRAVQYGTSSTQDMTGVRGAMTNHQQVVDTLNNQLKGNGDIHANADRLVAYITGADSQIDNAIATVGEFLAPITGGLSMDIADVILGPFVQSVTNGAEVFLANMIGGAEDRVDAEMVGRLTGDYSRLNELSVKYNVNTSKLQNLSQQIQNTLPKRK